MLLIQRPEIKALDEESENKQRFLISPLEPGFGHTLGNSLRRTLLSAIPGAAITHVLFDNAIHEFDVIDGVIEDVPDVPPPTITIFIRNHTLLFQMVLAGQSPP